MAHYSSVTTFSMGKHYLAALNNYGRCCKILSKNYHLFLERKILVYSMLLNTKMMAIFRLFLTLRYVSDFAYLDGKNE